MAIKKKDKKNISKNPSESYGASSITVLKGLEPVRKRPGMYIGGTSIEGLHHLIWEVVDNSIDEAMAGYCKNIHVTLHKGTKVTITDDGRGIPVETHKATKKSTLETVMTILHAGGKFGDGGYKVSGGLHGVGVSVVNALSILVRVEVKRDGYLWSQEYKRGKTSTKVIKEKKAKGTGTSVIFEPDPEIFPKIEFDWKTIITHLRQQAYLTKGVKISISDERTGHELAPKIPRALTFYFEGGILSYVRFLNRSEKVVHENPFYVEKAQGDVLVEVALQYTQEINGIEMAFANNIYTPEGGAHLMGFRTSVTRVINDYARKNGYLKEKEDNLTGDDVREGQTAVISLKLPNPQFEGQTKAKLGNSEIRPIVSSVVAEYFAQFLEEHPQDARQIMAKTLLACKARLAAKAAKDTVIRKGIMDGLSLPGKLADCSSKNPEESELYIVEGDSAGGCFDGNTKISLADGRDLSLKELVKEWKQNKQNYCYTIKNNNSIGIEKILNPRITKRNAQVIKIILDNNEGIIATPDHKFMLRDGKYIKAQDLKSDMSLMPFINKLSQRKGRITIEGYKMIFDPKNHHWIFAHSLADKYNLEHNVYNEENENYYRHHFDFNKLNNDPNNIVRMTKDQHLKLHQDFASTTLHRKDTIEKCNKIKKTQAYRQKISQTMKKMGNLLSQRAKKQWKNSDYKEYMAEKYLEFYNSNKAYQKKTLQRLDKEQKEYWAKKENRQKQSEKTKKYFENNPEMKLHLVKKAEAEWSDKALLSWRKNETKKQWTKEFRQKRKEAYSQTYLNSSLQFAKKILEQNGSIDSYDQERNSLEKKNTNLLKATTLVKRFFEGKKENFYEAVKNYNHKIKCIKKISKKIDVYDFEVPNSHNFALSSGIFVHNSAKQGRDRTFQAILPLRGKILNVERARIDKMLTSKEIKALIIAMGMGVGEEKEIEKMRYHRIIIMTDADVDGAHIRTLLLTFFYRYYQEIIKKGYLYIAQPPLYRIEKGKKVNYAYSDQEKVKILKEIEKLPAKKTKKSKIEKAGFTIKELKEGDEVAEEEKMTGVNIQRYKGLGEMNPSQLWETTMDPQNRVMLKVNVEDVAKADETFDILMGNEVEPRKRFIQTHATSVKNLDI